MGSKQIIPTILMGAAGAVVYAASADVRIGLALVAALLIGVSWHLEQRLEGLRSQIDSMSERPPN